MKTIQTKTYAPVEGKPGLVMETGKRKAVAVFQELEQALRELYLYPEEYFLLNDAFSDPNTDFPEMLDLQCYAQWGGSEGIYLEMYLLIPVDGKCQRVSFATGKTLDADSFAFDKTQYTAGVIYKLFMGERHASMRYYMEPGNEEQNKNVLCSRVQNELHELIRNTVLHDNEPLIEKSSIIGLCSLIAAILPYSDISESKVKELMDSDNALELLYHLCGHMEEGIFLEFDDLISESKSIKELIEENDAI